VKGTALWNLKYVNQYGDICEHQFATLDEVQIHLEACFKEVGEPFGFRCKWALEVNLLESTK
jgi:hypothetical protein